MPERTLVTISEILSWLACRMKHCWQYRELLVPTTEPEPLSLGSAVHQGLAAWYAHWDIQSAIDAVHASFNGNGDPALHLLAEGMLTGYIERYANEDTFSVRKIEWPFRVPLETPTGRRSRQFDLAGRIDLVLEGDGYWLMEHKTTSGQPQQLIERLDLDYQVRAYAWAVSRAIGWPVKGVCLNVLRSKLPQIPKVNKDGSISRAACDTTFEIMLDAIQKAGCYPADYQEQLDTLQQRGNTFFARQWYPLDQAELDSFAGDLYRIVTDMHAATQKGHTFKNPGACANYGGCVYRDLCTGRLSLEEIDGRFIRLDAPHPELADVDLTALRAAKTKRLTTRVPDAVIEGILDQPPPF